MGSHLNLLQGTHLKIPLLFIVGNLLYLSLNAGAAVLVHWATGNSITWELVRNAHSQVPF